MRIFFGGKEQSKEKNVSSKGNKDRRSSVSSTKSAKRVAFTTENDEFDLWDHNRGLGERNSSPRICWKPSLIPISIICALIVFVIFAPISDLRERLLSRRSLLKSVPNVCSSQCKIELVESIPEGLVYPDGSPTFASTYEAWNNLIKIAEHKIDIGTFYWTLRGADFYNHSSAWQGESIFNSLLIAGTKRKIKIRIAQSAPSKSSPNIDTEILAKRNAAEVRSVDFNRLLGGGVLHTKLWIIDDQHMYVGSANNDWRSLTQVKELGAVIMNCSCLVDDVKKVFNVYWDMGVPNASIPPNWPKNYSTDINNFNPIPVNFNGKFDMRTYFSSSPPPMSPIGRTQDVDAIVDVINKADKFIHIAVMDYIPITVYRPKPTYWPVIDDALRSAAINRRVSVKLLISWWKHSNKAEDYFLRSLAAISNSYHGVDIQVKRFIVPATDDQAQIPFARVNHNKYMVTDNVAYIGTSNWSADYFINTAGIGLVMAENSDGTVDNGTTYTVRNDLADVFERDWNSAYAVDLKAADLF